LIKNNRKTSKINEVLIRSVVNEIQKMLFVLS
jgi:hypothetical protein